MARSLFLGVVQCVLAGRLSDNLRALSDHIRMAADRGAQVILTPELIEGPYFCKTQDEAVFQNAYPWSEHPAVSHFSELASDLGVVLPVSIFEKDGPHYYNTVVVVDADGSTLGVYRKSHIPDGPGYQEKFYFRPGNTGFRVWSTRHGALGIGICWDQWFPEAARAMTMLGADVLLYPTAIGAEPQALEMDTKDRWQRVMQGHAAANVIPVAAANRVGTEEGQTFYGSSFIADEEGQKQAELDRVEEGIITVPINLDRVTEQRAAWGFFRDRRPDLYGLLNE